MLNRMSGPVDTETDAGYNAADLSWWVRYSRWKPTSLDERQRAEIKLLGMTGLQLKTVDTFIGEGEQQYVHSIQGGPANAPVLVCLPGYGAGAAFYFRNFPSLCEHFKVYAVDLLGNGMSGRPDFTPRDRQSAEAFFITSLEQWRRAMGLEKMILMGHSMGGYLSATYAFQYPDRIQHLVLVGPAGILKEPGYKRPPAMRNPWSLKGQLFRLATKFWMWGFTPGILIRGLGPLGKRWSQGYTRARFREGMSLSQEETLAFADYMFHITAAKGSGEHALRYILKPMGASHSPLEDRLQHLKVPVTFIYGDLDWTNPKGGARVCEQIKQQRGQLTDADLLVTSIPNAGHYPFLDQPQHFMTALLQQTRPYRPGDSAGTASNIKHAGAGIDVVTAGEDKPKGAFAEDAKEASTEDIILASLQQ